MTDLVRPPALELKLPTLDWIWATILLSPVLWAVLKYGYGMDLVSSHGDHLMSISQPRFVLDALIHISPYFAFAIFIGAYATATDAAELVHRAFTYNQPVAILLAGLAGVLSPLCSCGVIPLIAAMLLARVPLAPIMAFWLASPLMAPEQFAITQGAMATALDSNAAGVQFAGAKALFGLLIGLSGGYLTYALSKRVDLSSEAVLRPGLMPKSCCGSSSSSSSSASLSSEPEGKPVVWQFWTQAARRTVFWQNAWGTLLFLGKWLTLAFVLEALMVQLNLIEPLVGLMMNAGSFSIPISALLGTPAYLNGDAAPMMVSTFVERGLSQGAAMAFLIGGGVTCIPAAVAVWSLVRPTVFALYVAFGMAGAMLAGFGTLIWLG